jgi:hypothetical protein
VGQWTVGQWTVDSGQWTVDSGTVGLWDCGQSDVDRVTWGQTGKDRFDCLHFFFLCRSVYKSPSSFVILLSLQYSSFDNSLFAISFKHT